MCLDRLMDKRELAKYLADYIVHEMEYAREEEGYLNSEAYEPTREQLNEWIAEGMEAFESTQNAKIGVMGGDCKQCGTMMEDKTYTTIVMEDSVDIELTIWKYECPKCGYSEYL